MSEEVIQRYLSIREKYHAFQKQPLPEEFDLKKRRHEVDRFRTAFSACVTDLLALGREGHREAGYLLGDAYSTRQGVDFDRSKAIYWFRKAAEQGHVRAMVRLATALVHPDTPETAPEGIVWFTRAAESGDASAMVSLGFSYRDGRGTTRDLDKAEYWLVRAYEAGDIHSMVHVGRLHAWETQRPEKALPWLRRAADAGFTEGYWALVALCSDHRSRFHNPAEAVHWLRAIANTMKSSAPQALIQLARMTRDGQGTTQDIGLARTYVETALSLEPPRDVRKDAERLLADLNSSLL